MGMDRSVYVGPYVRCAEPISDTSWGDILEAMDEAMYFAGELEDPIIWLPNLQYPGLQVEARELLGYGDGAVELTPEMQSNAVAGFTECFSEAIAILHRHYARVCPECGIVAYWS